MKVSNIRKSQNLSFFNDEKSICLLHINIDVPIKLKECKSLQEFKLLLK